MSGRTEIRPSPARREHIWVESLLRRSLHDFNLRAAASSPRAMRPEEDFPELDCVRDRLPLTTIAAAERRALAVGVTADRVLITSGLLTEEVYVRALAQSLGLAFEPLETPERTACPISDERLIEARAAGRLGCAQSDRGCGSRNAARALWLRERRDRLHHLRGGPGKILRLAQAAPALVPRLDAPCQGIVLLLLS